MLRKYYRIAKAIGVNVHLESEGNVVLNACSVTIADNKLEIGKKLTAVAGFEALHRQLPKGAPVALNLTGRGVLIKKIEHTDTITDAVLSKVLPNANANEFYALNFLSGESSFIALIRKAEADRWISRFRQAGFPVLSLSLGPFVLGHILPQLNVYDNRITADGHTVEYDKDYHWTAYQYKQGNTAAFALKIDNERIEESLLIPYAAAFQMALSPNIGLVEAEVPDVNDQFKQKLDQQKLKVNAVAALCAFFVVLLVNFGLFSWLHSDNQRLTVLVAQNSRDMNDVQKIDEDVKEKEALVKSLGWEDNLHKSMLIDQIAQVLPPEVKWNSVAVNPPQDHLASGENKTPQFANRVIRITGYSAQIVPVNEWMARIRTRHWVKDVQMENYSFNNELNTGQFTIKIAY